jgi:hypothetical protein
MNVFFAPLQPFVWHPERIAAVAVGLAIVAAVTFLVRRRVAWSTAIAAIMWALFAVWEWQCKTERADIRVDLLLIYPVLLVFTVGGVIDAFLAILGGKHQFSLRAMLITMTLLAVILGLIAHLV